MPVAWDPIPSRVDDQKVLKRWTEAVSSGLMANATVFQSPFLLDSDSIAAVAALHKLTQLDIAVVLTSPIDLVALFKRLALLTHAAVNVRAEKDEDKLEGSFKISGSDSKTVLPNMEKLVLNNSVAEVMSQLTFP